MEGRHNWHVMDYLLLSYVSSDGGTEFVSRAVSGDVHANRPDACQNGVTVLNLKFSDQSIVT